MGISDPKRVIEHYYLELAMQRQLSLADEIIAPQFKLFENSPPPHGPEGVKRFISWLFEAFPDLTVTINQLVAEGGTVAARVTLHATHTASMNWMNELGGPITPTGQPFDMQEYVFWHVSEGKITGRDILIDTWGVARQLGLFSLAKGGKA